MNKLFFLIYSPMQWNNNNNNNNFGTNTRNRATPRTFSKPLFVTLILP